jgi:hypothetical protein
MPFPTKFESHKLCPLRLFCTKREIFVFICTIALFAAKNTISIQIVGADYYPHAVTCEKPTRNRRTTRRSPSALHSVLVARKTRLAPLVAIDAETACRRLRPQWLALSHGTRAVKLQLEIRDFLHHHCGRHWGRGGNGETPRRSPRTP